MDVETAVHEQQEAQETMPVEEHTSIGDTSTMVGTFDPTHPVVNITPLFSKPKLATLKVRWLKYDAISENNRQYTREAVDAMVRNAQVRISDTDAPPITCYVSHSNADSDNSRELVGRVTSVWMEVDEALATIDIADTHAGRDITSLVSNGYLTPVSLRAINATMKIDRNRNIPQVSGSPDLLGIDFTSVPGLPKIGKVLAVTLAESNGQAVLSEEFFDFAHVLDEGQETHITVEETHMETNETVAVVSENTAIPPQASGLTQGTDGTETRDDYSKRQYSLPPVENPNVTLSSTTQSIQKIVASADNDTPIIEEGLRESLKNVHNNAAAILSLVCADGTSREAGNVLNKKNRARIISMHDESAKALGMKCEGKTSTAPVVNDTDEDDMESANTVKKTTQESKQMTHEEMLAKLREDGYTFQAPKTRDEILQEQFEAKLAAQQQKFEESLAAQQVTLLEAIEKNKPVAPTTPVAEQRSVYENVANRSETLRTRRSGSILEGLKQDDMEVLAIRGEALPESMQTEKGLERAIAEFSQLLAYQIDQKYSIGTTAQ